MTFKDLLLKKKSIRMKLDLNMSYDSGNETKVLRIKCYKVQLGFTSQRQPQFCASTCAFGRQHKNKVKTGEPHYTSYLKLSYARVSHKNMLNSHILEKKNMYVCT